MYGNRRKKYRTETGSIQYLAGKCETLGGINFGDLCVAMPIEAVVKEYVARCIQQWRREGCALIE